MCIESQSNSPRLSTYCSLSKFFKLRLHLRSFFRRLPSVLLPSRWRYPGIVYVRCLSKESVALHFPRGNYALVPTSFACKVVTLAASSPTSSNNLRRPREFRHVNSTFASCSNLCRCLPARKASLSVDQGTPTNSSQRCGRRRGYIPFQRRCQGARGRPRLAPPRRRQQHSTRYVVYAHLADASRQRPHPLPDSAGQVWR